MVCIKTIGFIGLGVMGLPMAKNLVAKSGCTVMGYDVVQKQRDAFQNAGGIPADDPAVICRNCAVVMLSLPTHAAIQSTVELAIREGTSGSIIVDTSSAAPDLMQSLNKQAMAAGIYLLDSPVSGGDGMAIDGTLAIMTGGDRQAFDKVADLLRCMGQPTYMGSSGAGSIAKLANNMICGATMAAIAEAYSLAAKAGIDLTSVFEATRCGFAGGPIYESKVPKLIARDYTPGARIAVHRKDLLNAKYFAHGLRVDLPVTNVVLGIMDWMNDNGHINEDQIAMVKYFEDKMGVQTGTNPPQ